MSKRDEPAYAVQVHAVDDSEVEGGTLIVSMEARSGGKACIRMDGIDGWNFDASALSIGTAAALAEAVSGAVAAAVRLKEDGNALKDVTGKEAVPRSKPRYSADVYAEDEYEMQGGNVSVYASHPPVGESCVYVQQNDGWDFDIGEMTVETAAAFAEALSGAVAASLGKRPQPPFEPPERD